MWMIKSANFFNNNEFFQLLKTDPLDRISTFEDIKVLQFFPSLFDFENVHNYEIEIDESKPLSPEKITGYNFFQW